MEQAKSSRPLAPSGVVMLLAVSVDQYCEALWTSATGEAGKAAGFPCVMVPWLFMLIVRPEILPPTTTLPPFTCKLPPASMLPATANETSELGNADVPTVPALNEFGTVTLPPI